MKFEEYPLDALAYWLYELISAGLAAVLEEGKGGWA